MKLKITTRNKLSSVYKTEKRQILKDVLPIDTPFGIFIDPSSVCNFQCSFCPHSLNFQHTSKMDFNLFLKIIDDIKKFSNKIKLLRLYCLGEPLLNSDFCNMLNAVMKANIAEQIEVATNASLLTQDTGKKIIEIAKASPNQQLNFKFSIYSMYQKKNEAITKSPIPVEIIQKNIRNFSHLRNKNNIDNIFLYAKMIDPDEEELNLFLEVYKDVVDSVGIEAKHYWHNRVGTEKVSKKSFTDKFAFDGGGHVCAFPFHTMVIHSDGSVVCCCVDWEKALLIGDANTTPLKKIWNGIELQRIRLLHLKHDMKKIPICANCDYISYGKSPIEDNLDNCAKELYEVYSNQLVSK